MKVGKMVEVETVMEVVAEEVTMVDTKAMVAMEEEESVAARKEVHWGANSQ